MPDKFTPPFAVEEGRGGGSRRIVDKHGRTVCLIPADFDVVERAKWVLEALEHTYPIAAQDIKAPISVPDPDNVTIRDYFAACAMELAWQREGAASMDGMGELSSFVAQTAYELSDAMLAERAKASTRISSGEMPGTNQTPNIRTRTILGGLERFTPPDPILAPQDPKRLPEWQGLRAKGIGGGLGGCNRMSVRIRNFR